MEKTVATNRKARHEYHIEDTYQAGMVLTGTEIKSVRAGRVNLQDSYARLEEGEVWLHHVHISPYEQGNRYNVDPLRRRKLLLHRGEIRRLAGRTAEKGLTLVPLRVYLARGYAKVQLGLARGKRQYDKRQAIAERDQRREQERELHHRQEDSG